MIELFRQDTRWPPEGEAGRLLTLTQYRKLFEGDLEQLRIWSRQRKKNHFAVDEFVPYPAPEIAVRTLSTFLFGEPALVTSMSAQDAVDEFLDANHFHALTAEAAATCAHAGEIFLKLDMDEELSDQPILSTVPADAAFGEWRFGRLTEVAFVRDLPVGDAIYRHVEMRWRGRIEHHLWRGSSVSLGRPVPLEDNSATAMLQEVITTGIPDLLARHVPFWRTSDDPHGISIFRGKTGLIDALHSLYSQDQHDAELAKKRLAVASGYLKRDKQGNPKFDRSLDLFELDEAAMGALGGEQRPIHPIDFADSNVMGLRIAQRIDEFLLACGIAPQSAGRDVAGGAESGTARRLAQSLTLQTVGMAARYFIPALTDLIGLAVWGMGQASGEPDVAVTLRDGMVDDPVETSARVAGAHAAGIMSTETAVKEIHDGWGQDEVDEEVARIVEEEGLKIPTFGELPPEPEPGT